MTDVRQMFAVVCVCLGLAGGSREQQTSQRSCFLLTELGGGQVVRRPVDACQIHVTPASTFKVPHAIAALDSGVVTGPDERMKFPGGEWPESARRDHTLATAVRHSVLWYFQAIAERLGLEREKDYVRKFRYGNLEVSGELTRFWIGGSLQITPLEQQEFWLRFYRNQLPVSAHAADQVKAMLIQPNGHIVNAAGEQPFGGRWPETTIVSAKTGSATDRSGQAVRWLAGHVKTSNRSFVFVSCVIGPRDVAANAAIDLAARSLRTARVF